MPATADDYDEYYDEQPRRSTGKTIGIVAAVVVALGLIGFFAYQVFSGPPAAQMVAVPTVTGLSDTDARNQIIAAGLRLGEVTQAESSVEERGRVIRTDPQVGTAVPERTLVNLVVGSGPASVTVPRLESLTLAEAQAELEEAGLVLGTQSQSETSNTNLVGKVIESTPQAGESAPGGSAVAVVVGIQQTTVQIPDLAGRDLDDAERALRDLGLSPQRADGSDDNDRVSGTDPAAGQRVQPGSDVTLLTGNGDEIEMPDVVGRTQDQAEDLLRDRGFQRIQVREESVNNEAQEGRVTEQSIEPGQRVAPDQQITLTVGDSPGVFGN